MPAEYGTGVSRAEIDHRAYEAPAFFAPKPKYLGRGLLLWLAFGVAALLLRGVRWDEDFEFAQAMTGLVPYPDGHPLPRYTRGAYNLQFYTAALTVLLDPRPVILCGIRNLLFIWSTVAPPFLLGAVATGRALWGHVAAALFLVGLHLEFDGAYPLFLWPGMFSNGHIGIAYCLVIVVGVALGWTRLVFLLFGLMPAIHLGQMAPILLLMPLFIAAQWRLDGWTPLKRALPYLAAGLVFCLGFFAVQQSFALPPPDAGPYAAEGDARAIWEGRIAHHDMHRAIPTGNSHLLVAGTALLALGGLAGIMLGRLPGAPWLWFGSYIGAVVGIVYAIMAFHMVMGTSIPYLVLGWLPYRLINHLPPILLALILAVLFPWSRAERGHTTLLTTVVCAVLAVAILQPLLESALPAEHYERYLQSGAWMLYGLWGFTAGTLVWRMREVRWCASIAGAVTACSAIALLAFHQWGAVCAGAGIAGSVIVVLASRRIPQPGSADWPPRLRTAAACLVAVLVAMTLAGEYRRRAHLPIPPFRAEGARILNERGDPNAMIIGPPHQLLLQAHTGHPVMVDMATGFHASYVPSLGPSIQKIYGEIYGIYFNPATAPENQPESWQELWEQRSGGEWSRIAQRYNAPYLIAPNSLTINRPVLHQGQHDTLYRIQNPDNADAQLQ